MLAIQPIHRTSDTNEQHELRQGRREGAHGARGLNSTTDKQGPLIAQWASAPPSLLEASEITEACDRCH